MLPKDSRPLPSHSLQLWPGGVNESYLCQKTAGDALTVSGVRYREISIAFLWPKLNEVI